MDISYFIKTYNFFRGGTYGQLRVTYYTQDIDIIEELENNGEQPLDYYG